VVQATEDWQGLHAPPARGLALRHASWGGDLLLNALMWALLVEVRDIGPQGTPEMGLPQDQHMVQALAANAGPNVLSLSRMR